MPVKHDPALRTPERVRAVSALQSLGLLQLLFAAVCLFVIPLSYWIRWGRGFRSGGNPFTVTPLFEYLVELPVALVLPSAILGISAVMAATGICRRRGWGPRLGFAGTIASLLWFIQGWLFGFLYELFCLSPYDASCCHDARWTSPSPQFCLFTLYLCIGTVLVWSTMNRLGRFLHSK